MDKEKVLLYIYLVCLSFHCTAVVPTLSLSVPSPMLGYKLVGDNLDIGVKTCYRRLERYGKKSLHYFHCFAIQNQIVHSDKSDVYPDTCQPSPLH